MSAAPTPAEVTAARREYDHQREHILEYLSACEALTNRKGSGGRLITGDHFGAEFDTAIVREIAEAFLAVSDVRMQVGSSTERVALATLTWQFRRLLPNAPLTATLADAAERAVGAADEIGAADARDVKAEDDAARIDARRAIIGPMLWEAQRKAVAAGQPFLVKSILGDVNAALVAALEAGMLPPRRRQHPKRYPEISEATLRRDVEMLPNPVH